MKTITRFILFCVFILCSSKAFSQIKFTIHATSTSATTITVTGSGSATTNGNGTSWSDSNGVNQIFGNSSFDFVNSNINFKTFNLTGDLQLTNGATPINFSAIVLDDDTGSDYDDFAMNVGTTTATASNTLYTLSGSATFDISGTATFADLMIGIFSGTFSGSQFGFSNFNTSDIIIEVLLGTPNATPSATNINFTGTLEVGQQLSGTYTYADAENDTESGTTFIWYRSDDNAGTNKVAISGATSQIYTLVTADGGKYISFEVTPNDGTSAGTAVESNKNGPITSSTPILTTTNAAAVTDTSATLGGEVILQGESSVTERGIVYSSTDTNPKIGDTNVTKDDNGTGTGVFSENITGLTANTTYFYRAYAINTQGTDYGAVKTVLLNNALNFDGTNDRITIADNAAFDFSSGFTAEAWINPDVLGTQTYLSQYASSQEAFAFILLSSGKIEFTVTTDGSTDQFFESSTAITAGTWSHVALTFNGTTVRAYINGVAAGTKAVSGTMFNSTSPIEIGARNNAHFFNGNIDEVRVWTRVLTEAEILAQKDGILPSTVNGLAAYYKFDQGIAEGDNTGISTLTDSGPNSLHGTLSGGFTKTGTTSNFVNGASGTFENGIMAPNTFSTTGNWSTASNWSLGVVPTQVDKAIIGNGKTVTINIDDLKIDDFTLESGATLSIPKGKEIIIQNSFVSNGNLELGSDKTDSGVLLIEGTTSGNITYKRGGLLANKWSIVTPPVSGQTVKTFAENATNAIRVNTTPNPNRYAIGYYDDAQATGSKWQYYDANVNAATEFTAGQSYAISRSTDGEISFTGTLTVDNLTKTLVANQWNAIGNPFTTYYPANKNSNSSFLNDNNAALDDAFKSVYIWDNDQNKYAAISEVDANNRSLPPGQGFFVFMKTGQTEVTFNENKRSTKPATGSTGFAKNTNLTPSITLKLSDNTTTVKTYIKYFNTATQGLDPGYDIGNFNGASLDIYSRLTDNSSQTNLTIQSLPNSNYEKMIVPIGISAKANKEVSFSLEKQNIPANYKIYLEDKTLNTFNRLDKENAVYKISFTEKNITTGRFYIHVTPSVLATDDFNLSKINVFVSQKRTLNISGLEHQNATIQVFDLLGKTVNKQIIKGNINSKLQVPKEIKSGIYIVKITTEKGSLSKKIILK